MWPQTFLINLEFVVFLSTRNETELKGLRSKAEQYLKRAEEIKKEVKSGEGQC